MTMTYVGDDDDDDDKDEDNKRGKKSANPNYLKSENIIYLSQNLLNFI